ncbi:MAG TPA: cell division protein FtsZ [Gaiellaceae bacterium]|jgi:cell division protein FtsZ
MREGPLAELFRATEAAQKGKTKEPRATQEPVSEPAVEKPSDTIAFAPTEILVPAPPEPSRAPAVTPPPVAEEASVARWLDPLPENPARFERSRDSSSYLAVIRVVGVGGAGLNALDRMMDAGITQVDFIAVNTDIQQLQMSDVPTKIHIGSELTEGLGSGADPEIGRRSAEDSYDALKRALRGSDMVFVTAGEGGGTGSGAAPVVARIARELGALTVGIVTTPFKFEGSRRMRQADEGVDTLRGACDTVIVIPNDRLLEVLDRSTSMLEAFRIADDVLRQGVQGICDLITNPGLINLDFADVRTVMKDAGSALMGIGFAEGPSETRAREAAERALRSPLIETEITGARGILLSIAGGDDLSLYEVNEAAEVVRAAATDDTNIIFGATIDGRLTGQIWITVIATGLGGPRRPSQRTLAGVGASSRSSDPYEAPAFLSR